MRPRLGRARRPLPLVVLTPGWCGEHVLIRLLSANGAVRSSGFWLSVARRSPADRLHHLLNARTDDALHVVLVRAGDLFGMNNLDANEQVARMRGDGIAIMSLLRRSAEDTGVSRTLCGPEGEVLPDRTQLLEPAEVSVHTANARSNVSWLAEVVPNEEDQIVFEDDLEEHHARAATIARVSDRFGLRRWEPPPESDVPSSKLLWSRVANPEKVTEALATASRYAPAGQAP